MELSSHSGPAGGKPPLGKPVQVEDAHFDITAMVDLVFMMNIFFLVTWVSSALAEVDLPAAQRGVATDVDSAVVITVVAGGEGKKLTVHIGEDGSGTPLTDMEEIERQVREAAEAGVAAGKDVVLIKGEKMVELGDLVRVGSAISGVEGAKLRLAVMEKD